MSEQDDNVSRRDFIEAAGAATVLGASALAAGAAEPKATLNPDRKIRIGVVGGGFGSSFQWHLDPNCTVEAVSDLIPGRRAHLQRRYKCEKPYESLEKLVLDPKIEAVAVFTEAPNHARHVLECMKHGKHAISAVPTCLTLEEAAQMKEMKEKTGLKYMMAETSYYRAPCIFARELWADGKFGRFVFSEVEYYHPGIGAARDGLSVRGGKRTWRYGYPPMLYPTHSTAFHVGVTRERFTHVSCLGWADGDPARKDNNPYGCTFANQTALFRASGGNICRCNVYWNIVGHGERAQWLGEKLSMFMASWSGQPFVVKGGNDVPRSAPSYAHLLPEPMRIGSGHGGSHTFITHEFIAALVENREPAVDLYEALAMTVPGIVAMESAAKGGEQIAIPNFDKA